MRTDFAGSGLADVHDENGTVIQTSVPFDKLGQPVFPDSIIAYGHALGRCAGLRIGRVLELFPPPPDPKPYSWGHAGWKAKVIGVDDDWSGRPPSLLDRTGTLFFPDRWIVLADEQVPAAYRNLLASYVAPEPKRKQARKPPLP